MFVFEVTKDISSEILIIYGLIALVIALIIIIVVLDKKEKKRFNMTKTQELRLMDLRRADDNYIDEYKLVEKLEKLEVKKEKSKTILRIENKIQSEEEFAETFEIDDNMYVEDDLEKTSAQLKLEELANELMKVQESQENKISRFEAEQEENAIISYNELLKVSSKLYDENEKIQYSDEGNEPITIDQLRNRFTNNNQDGVEVL